VSLRMYETIYVLRPDLSEDAQRKVFDRINLLIEEDDGKVFHADDWGTRKTAYPVQKFTKGHFVQLTYAGSPGVVGKIERIMRILDEVMKFFSMKVSDEVTEEQLAQEFTRTVSRRDESEPRRRDDRRRGDRRDRRND